MKVYDSRGVMKTLKANFAELSTTAQAVDNADLIPYSQVISGVNRTQNIAKSTLVTGGGVSFTDSAGLRANISDPTGTGKAVFYNSPNFLESISVYGDLADTDFGQIAIYNDVGYVLGTLYGSAFTTASLRRRFFFNLDVNQTNGMTFYAAATAAPITFNIGSVPNEILGVRYTAPHVTVTGILKVISGDSTYHSGLLITDTVTDGATKSGGIRTPHYSSGSEEDVTLISWGATTTTNTMALGSVDGNANSLTILKVFLAASNTTIASSATEMMRWNSVGMRLEKGVTATADASCMLDMVSTAQGLGFPVMTTTQKNAINAREGNAVWDVTLHKLCVYAAAAWQTVTSI